MAYPKLPPTLAQRPYCTFPDAVTGGTWQQLERLLQRAGYYSTGLLKLDLARRVADQMDVRRNNSPSFCQFRDALVALTEP